jgi:hydroxylaminobenzene mutase
MNEGAAPTAADTTRWVCWLGVALVLLGLATGALIPLFDDARRGLAAHTAGVQNGVLLTVLGLLWPRLRLTKRTELLAATGAVFSLYAIWIAFVLAAAFGTGTAVPGAESTHPAGTWQATMVSSVRGAGSMALLASLLAVLWGLRPARSPSE